MNLYTTTINAIKDGNLLTFCGPNVPGISFEDAETYCEMNGLGYCKVDGLLISEIPCKRGSFMPDFRNRIDFDIESMN